ncbi:MAG: FAD/NAD(P)-binding oxidoreductase [Bacteroidales bacterium]|nr:FAD/NAD(P)-binding oxidoreductase [Bacteroidales bacterium]
MKFGIDSFADGAPIGRRSFLKINAALAGTAALGMSGCSKLSACSARGKIVIVGGGAAGISMASRLLGKLEHPDITLIDPSDRQYYQPGFTFVAAGIWKGEEIWRPQSKCIPEGVKWVKDSVVGLDPVRQAVQTSCKGTFDYDFLVLTPGLQLDWDGVEGISQATLGEGNAHCIYDFEGAQKTWAAVQQFVKRGGRGVYADTYTKHKCGGAPKKICLLTEHLSRKEGTREKLQFDYFTAEKALYDVPYYTPRLEEIYDERHISITTNRRVKGIDTLAQKVYMEDRVKTKEMVFDEKLQKEVEVEKEIGVPVIEDYDFLHFVPPMSAPDFVKQSGLAWTEGKLASGGWVMVDKETLVHKTFPNVVSLGDVAGIPTSKTSSAIRIQVPVAVDNLIALMEGRAPERKYDGYACCPIVTDYGHVLLCEFDYDKKEKISFPFSLQDMSREQASAWWLKMYFLKPMYFNAMLTGWM